MLYFLVGALAAFVVVGLGAAVFYMGYIYGETSQ